MASSSSLFLCEICGEGFSSNSHLTRHLKKHSADQASWDEYLSKYCPGAVAENECETCKKIFASKNSLKRHIYYCKGPKGPVNVPICKTCNKVFRDNFNLKKHINAQCCNDDELDYSCGSDYMCAKNFKMARKM